MHVCVHTRVCKPVNPCIDQRITPEQKQQQQKSPLDMTSCQSFLLLLFLFFCFICFHLFDTESLPSLELDKQARLAGYKGSGFCLSPGPRHRLWLQAHTTTLTFYFILFMSSKD